MLEAFGITTKLNKNTQDNLLIYGVLPKLVFDNDTFDILHANNALAEIFGYTETELSQLKLNDIIADDFSTQIDNEDITFPLGRVKRQFFTKNGSIINFLSESCEIDFDCSALFIHVDEQPDKNKQSTKTLADKVYSSVFLNASFSNN